MSTVLIIGAGPNVGKACAENFSAAGFKVAVASRTQKLDPKYRHYTFDASKPETVPALFEHVSADIGVPSVVIYNSLSFFEHHPTVSNLLQLMQRELPMQTSHLTATLTYFRRT